MATNDRREASVVVGATLHPARATPAAAPRRLQPPSLPPRSISKQTVSTLGGLSAYEHADDELTPSVLSLHLNEMTESSVLVPEPRYPGEDTRPTSKKELYGFYSYSWAVEVFVVCGVGSFIPITLEQLTREVGVLLADPSISCKTGFSFTPPPPGYNITSLEGLTAAQAAEQGQCVVDIGVGGRTLYVNTASFAMYTFSFSVFIQALVIISMSGAADHGRYRKSFLLGFAILGAIATMLFIFVTSKVFMIGALLAIVANTCFGASFVLLNSFLPLLVRHHPAITPVLHERDSFAIESDDGNLRESFGDGDENVIDSTTGLLGRRRSSATIKPAVTTSITGSPELQLSTKISSNGIAVGYVAAIIVQVVAALIVFFAGGSLFSLKLVLLFVGAWWLVFTLPAAAFLRPRPGPPLEHASSGNPKRRTWTAYVAHAWIALGKTLMRARRLKDMVLFLCAWFLLSDGIATVSGTAILFAKTTLGMKPAALAMINVVVMLFGVLGALGWSHFSAFFHLKPSHTVLACIIVFEIIPIYALLGYIPALQRLGFLGLQRPWEIYPLGALYGLVMGGLSSYCRSLFGELIPPGNEASFYALYAITDKGSSIFGPLIVGAITDATGSIRPAFWFLAVLIGLPGPILWFVDVDRGRAAARALGMELEAQGGDEENSNRVDVSDE